MQVSVLGFGAAEIGFQGTSQTDVERLLGTALDEGLNVIDTAECYADSETKIGKAIGGRREDYYLFTKCGHPGQSGLDALDWSAELMQGTLDRSLIELRTDRVDLLQLHSCSLEHLQRGEVVEFALRAKTEGKTRYIGYSGDSEAAQYAVELGVFDALQTSVNLADQEAIELNLPLAKERGLGVIAKRPVANVVWLRRPVPDWDKLYDDRLNELDYPFLASSADVETALRFTLGTDVHTMIVGTVKPGRWAENAAIVAKGPLPIQEMRAIRDRWKAIAKPDWSGYN